jgi:hypothetical protein
MNNDLDLLGKFRGILSISQEIQNDGNKLVFVNLKKEKLSFLASKHFGFNHLTLEYSLLQS